jgi:hypothetical protein
MGENRGMTPHELCTLVPRHLRHLHLQLRLRWRLLLLHMLHGYQGLTNRLNYLSLHQKHLLDSHWGVVATTAEVPHPRLPAAPVGHAFHLDACCQTSKESIHTSYLTLQSFSVRKDVQKSS